MNHPQPFQETLRDKLNREKMVEQLVASGSLKTPDVIRVFKQVPRHFFVDRAFRHRAYQDLRLPIGCDQTISRPSTVARMTELLELTPNHRILEVGSGCGYQTAILGLLSKKVYSVEWHQQLVHRARANMVALSLSTIRVEQGDGSQGWPAAAPFDRIIVSAEGDRRTKWEDTVATRSATW